MDNEVTINIDEIKLMDDNSVKDFETIRQISMYSLRTGDTTILNKIYKPFEVAGLYPYAMKAIESFPEVFTDENITKAKSFLNDIFTKR